MMPLLIVEFAVKMLLLPHPCYEPDFALAAFMRTAIVSHVPTGLSVSGILK
jgi:hypothetical protein